MHGSKLPLTVWFWAAYLMATHSNGISARPMWRELGLGSYNSAWLLCAKPRRAMVNSARALLSGVVEIDETQISYRTKDDPVAGGGGRSPDGKMRVVAAVEVIDKALGRLRLGVIEDGSSASLHPLIKANVTPGTTLKTEGWSGYRGVPGFTHEPHVVGTMAAHIVLPWVHSVFSNLKTLGLGVYHGLRRPHLQSYLDEFVFRFNLRRTPHAVFKTLLGIAVTIQPATYNMMIAAEGPGISNRPLWCQQSPCQVERMMTEAAGTTMRDEVLERLRADKARLDAFGIQSVAVFGSCARGEARTDSDVDLLVHFHAEIRPDLFDFIDLPDHLRGLLDRPVALVMLEGLTGRMRRRVLAEVVYA